MNTALTLESYPRPSPSALAQPIGDELVLLLPQHGSVRAINAVGRRIWELADGSRSVREIATTIYREYDVTQAQAEADTLHFVGVLIQRGLLAVS